MSAMLSAMLAAEFGDDYGDLREAMADRPGFASRDLDDVAFLAIHHTAGRRDAPWASIRDMHQVPPRGWAGIGYHVGIQRGVVSYLGDVTLARACVGRLNHRVICVVVAGDYTADALADEDRDALRRVVLVLDRLLGREVEVRGHGQLPGQSTACPGRAILDVLPAIRQQPAGLPVGERRFELLRRIRDGLDGREVIALNPAAGLQRAIRAAGYVPTTPEWSEIDSGAEYVCQGAATVANGRIARRVYFVQKPLWDAIRYVEVGR